MAAVLATLLVLGLGSSSPAVPLPDDADPDAQVQALHDLGANHFEAAEYEQALIMWKQAFVLLSHEHDRQSTRAVLIANILAAHVRAHEVGRNPEHLVEAMRVVDLRKAELAHVAATSSRCMRAS